jgi:hypothetical protein
MEFNQHPDEKANNNSDSKPFILTWYDTAANEGSGAPEQSRNQKPEEKLVPDFPWPVTQQNNE